MVGKDKRKLMAGASTENLAAILPLLKTILKLPDIDLFYGDRRKFQAYYIQCRIISYSTGKMTLNPFKFVFETIVYWATRLRGSAFNRFEPYLNHFLKKGTVAEYEEAVATIFTKKEKYLSLLK